MKEFHRDHPRFSLCGLNCGLCPRYHIAGNSKCPGCGGTDFYQKHPSCGIISCSLKHGGVEFCFECADFPCERYTKKNDKDSFISYQHVLSDFAMAKRLGVEQYIEQLDRKVEILEHLINNYNDGRSKNFYCTAVNLLSLEDLDSIMSHLPDNESVNRVVESMKELAQRRGIDLNLRK